MLRQSIATVGFIDECCLLYRSVFEDVRSYECFKWLHVGMVSKLPRKTLPEIAKLNGLKDGQSLHHFLRDSSWSVAQVRAIRLHLIQQQIGVRPISLCIDETGDVKKGQTTGYVAKQYIGNLGKTENGMVSVNAYAVVENITYPLLFKIYKPKDRLKANVKIKRMKKANEHFSSSFPLETLDSHSASIADTKRLCGVSIHAIKRVLACLEA